ncbi:MAG TPA: CapA family protein [Burkholderiales bacterium]|nr:CapA family protein [Burkholderiales bacterium]
MTQLTLFLCGDVMTGRGIDQILAHPSEPSIHEVCMRSATDYVRIAEEKSGSIPRPADPAYVWGDALGEFERVRPDARIVNLETAVTCSGSWLDKGINYRMHPDNVGCLTAARIDCCALANNHVLDWGPAGLLETLDTLHAAGVKTTGAGRNRAEAAAPAVIGVGGRRRVLVFSFAAVTSGVPPDWAASEHAPGVEVLADLAPRRVDEIAVRIGAARRQGDLVIASIHWGGNWGYAVSRGEIEFAHGLIDRAGVDLVHGHSSHHPKAIELHAGKLILYGCGDLINDYEGIGGHETYRNDLGLMYFATLDVERGKLQRLEMVAMQMKRFRLQRAAPADVEWLRTVLGRESRRFGTSGARSAEHAIELH